MSSLFPLVNQFLEGCSSTFSASPNYDKYILSLSVNHDTDDVYLLKYTDFKL
jgi:hypothetical protein